MSKHKFFDSSEWDNDVPNDKSQLDSIKPLSKQKKKKNKKNKQAVTTENVAKVSKESKKKLKAKPTKENVGPLKVSTSKKEKIKEVANKIKNNPGGNGTPEGVVVVSPAKSKKRKNKKESKVPTGATADNKSPLGKAIKKNKKNKEKAKTNEVANTNETSNNGESELTKSKKKRLKKQLKRLSKENKEGKTDLGKKLNKTKLKNQLKLEKLLKAKDASNKGSKSTKDTTSEIPKAAENGGSSLKDNLMEKLKGSRFRYLNEQLYTITGNEAAKLFKDDPEAFTAYHKGYARQVQKWTLNPLDQIIKEVKKMPKDQVVADFGCGEARLSTSVKQKVFSLDLVALNENVTSCDMAHTSLKNASVDIVVFCLSLMGTNLKDYLSEANRVLKIGGVLKIAEVASRFTDVSSFIGDIQKFGFKNTSQNLSNDMFYFMDFKKETELKVKKKLPKLQLNPCYYKKR